MQQKRFVRREKLSGEHKQTSWEQDDTTRINLSLKGSRKSFFVVCLAEKLFVQIYLIFKKYLLKTSMPDDGCMKVRVYAIRTKIFWKVGCATKKIC